MVIDGLSKEGASELRLGCETNWPWSSRGRVFCAERPQEQRPQRRDECGTVRNWKEACREWEEVVLGT